VKQKKELHKKINNKNNNRVQISLKDYRQSRENVFGVQRISWQDSLGTDLLFGNVFPAPSYPFATWGLIVLTFLPEVFPVENLSN
jgi:hypothetical protein